MPPLFDTSRIRMNPRGETAEMAHGLNSQEWLPSQAADVGQPAFIRAHLIERLMVRLGLDKSDAHALVDAFFELIMQALQNGEAVRLSGFGCFQLRDKHVDSWDERRPPFGELGTLPPEWSSVIVWENRKESMWQSVATATT